LQAFNVDEHSLATLGIDRPKTALPVPLHALGWAVPNAFAKLDKQANLIPLRLANTCGEAVAEQIRNEVEHALEELDEAMDVVRVDGGSIPIPQRLLNQIFDAPETYPACTQIIKKIERLSSELDAFFLPGGNDLPPRLYGQQQAEETLFNGDYYQSVMELAMVYYAVNRGIPLMGICRGFQLVNVFFGAQLIQDLIGHYGKIQTYAPLKLEKEPAEMGVVPSPYRGLCDEAVQNYIVSISAHHQAVLINQGPTEYIEPTITYSDVLKAAEPKFPAAPMILLQFHPDLYGGTVSNNFEEQWGNIACDIIASSTNDKFWKILHDSALANKRKKECLNGLKALPI
jgi:gamma-glutamyl-gamma-aminobutyrate hydrolase PuuD